MSTSPESIRAGDRIVTAVSRWLVHHSAEDELRAQLQAVDLAKLSPEQAEAVLELQNELEVGTERPGLEAIARETLEAVAAGGCLAPR
jgi:plasmid stability protein